MQCPCCEAADLIHDTRDMPYVYKGRSTSVPAVTCEFCPACGEVLLNREHGDQYINQIAAFQRQVDAGFMDPA